MMFYNIEGKTNNGTTNNCNNRCCLCQLVRYLDGFHAMTKPLNREEYWAKIIQDLKDAYGFGESDMDRNTLASFKVMFDMGWDLHLYTQTDQLPDNMHEAEDDSQETFIEIPSVFEKLYDKGTRH